MCGLSELQKVIVFAKNVRSVKVELQEVFGDANNSRMLDLR